MESVLNDIKKEYRGKLIVQKIDVYKHMDMSVRYNVRYLPTIVFLNEADELYYRHEGTISKDDIIAILIEMGVNQNE
jgi:thioredoxin 1